MPELGAIADGLATTTSRRGFHARVSKTQALAAGAGAVGAPLLHPDGRPLPAAPRSRVCQDAVARRFDLHTRIDGAWYRCCGGHVRKLVDCCARTRRRINGDAALTGYCYSGRRVFCVMYYDTKIPC